MASPSRRVRAAAVRVADQQSSRLAEMPNGRHLRATVQAVVAGGAADGNALVTVTYRGENRLVNGYPDSYTPVVGHRVLCVVVDMQLSILHRSIGTP